MTRLCKVTLALLGLGVLAGAGAIMWIAIRGVSARDEPTGLEAVIARAVRRLAIPTSHRKLTSPVPASAEVLAHARAHFADHCALCHANDGSGQTEVGRHLYPKAPDMRLVATQSLTDGELFAIIRNGVRLTGMPAWGDDSEEDGHETWGLVQFIRHLPQITPAEVEGMRALNPKTQGELDEARRIEEFLGGGGGAPSRKE